MREELKWRLFVKRFNSFVRDACSKFATKPMRMSYQWFCSCQLLLKTFRLTLFFNKKAGSMRACCLKIFSDADNSEICVSYIYDYKIYFLSPSNLLSGLWAGLISKFVFRKELILFPVLNMFHHPVEFSRLSLQQMFHSIYMSLKRLCRPPPYFSFELQ